MHANTKLAQFDWTLVRSLLSVLDEGSLQAAGRKLGLSQPTVSRHMSDLETQLGLALFERTGRGLVPTRIALNLAESARVMEEGALALAQAVSGAQDTGLGTVRITASQPVACVLLPPLLKRMRQEMPQTQIELVSSNAVDNLLRREADIAVRMVQPNQASVVARRIGKINLGAYAHRDYLRRRTAPKSLDDLLNHDLIGNDRSEQMINGFAKYGLQLTRENFAFRTDDLIAGWQAVRAGLGIGFIADYLAITDQQLVRILPDIAIPPIPVWLAVHREVRTNKRIRAVYSFLATQLPAALEPAQSGKTQRPLLALAPRSRHLCASRIINRSIQFARSNRLNQPFADCLDSRQLLEAEIALTANSDPHFIGCLQHPKAGLIKPDLRRLLQTGPAYRIHADSNRLNLRRLFDSDMSTLSSVHQSIRDFLTILDHYRHLVPGDVWFALYLSWIFGAILFIVMQRRSPSATLAWTIGFLSLPFIGAAVYFFFGPRKLNRRRMRRALARDLAARLTPAVKEEMPQRLLDRQSLSALARVGSSQGDAPPRASLGVRLFDGGDDTYAAIEAAMRAAHQQIHIEYYIFEPDVIGTRWRDLLAERARAGISVRLLVDALGSKSCTSAFFKPLTDAGAQVRQFNPALLMKLKPGMLNFRTHRKIVVIDGKQAFTGGINVSAGNSGSSSGGTAWRDTHMEVLGAPALDLQVVFLEDWLYAGMGHEKFMRRDRHLSSPTNSARRHRSPPRRSVITGAAV